MPTYGRSALTRLAIDSYLSQSYSERELIVIDDSPEPLEDLFLHVPNHTYVWRPDRSTIGTKRNEACDLAMGEIVAHFDADDLSAPFRIELQVRILLDRERPICGFNVIPFFDICTSQAMYYSFQPKYILGTSLAYYRPYWEKHPFPDLDIAEDLIYTAQHPENRTCASGIDAMVALVHSENTSTRTQIANHPKLFPKIPTESLPDWFRESYLPKIPLPLAVEML